MPPPPARAPLSPFAALRHRNFRLFYTGQTISLIGTWMQQLAQGWLVLQLTDSAFWVGLVSFLAALPVMLFGLAAGELVDRSDKHALVARCQAAMLLVALVLTALVAADAVRPWHVAGLAFLLGCANAIEIPARQSMVVELVGKDDLTNAIALNSSAFNATRIIGPALAGVLVARVGLAVCFALNALSYLAVLEALRRMRMPPWQAPAREGSVRSRLGEGLRYVRTTRPVLALIGATAVLSLFGFPAMVLLPVFARDVFDVGAEGLGVMSAAIGLGAMVAALGLAAFAPRVRRGRLVALASTAFGACIIAFAFAPWFALAVVLLAAAGFAMVLNNAASNTLLQGLLPDALRGRVMALWSLVFIGFAPLGSLQAGWLAGQIGPGPAVAVGGAAASLAMLVLWRRLAPEVVRLR